MAIWPKPASRAPSSSPAASVSAAAAATDAGAAAPNDNAVNKICRTASLLHGLATNIGSRSRAAPIAMTARMIVVVQNSREVMVSSSPSRSWARSPDLTSTIFCQVRRPSLDEPQSSLEIQWILLEFVLTALLTMGNQTARPCPQSSIVLCASTAQPHRDGIFNKLASERGMTVRATFRGVSPQEALSVRAVEGLRADGVPIPQGKPTAIGEDDVAEANYIFAIGCVLPRQAAASGKAADWTDVPDDQGYGPMRDAIVAHVRALLDDVQRKKP
jgi:protein-tyrosine-phosphatase